MERILAFWRTFIFQKKININGTEIFRKSVWKFKMSFNALVELLIQVHEFRNIDLHNQGVYQLKITGHYEYKDV